MNIGKAIKLCRELKGLSKTILAEKAEISISYLTLIEQGKRDPSFSTINNICEALEVPLSIVAFLGADKSELSTLSSELTEKLSGVAINLIRNTDDSPVHEKANS
ncbi:helix-turn-helix domain-containing protein [Spartinivicinus poritis]|uniref:Helix-turn-helix transcriptional regulator n=1 Tax=Spartinivicinus poritis TaxID=2994640 RepID=A0ABT5UEM5_9GAMM|nr:helix-turn-helix transcriptional regulator [Spartinivicinus sp. A2-2]MDE1464831.1 helix-turn-helix transcriptional regulator [Spartinivicinus sp. A2-2]